jgi:hypothetical protein
MRRTGGKMVPSEDDAAPHPDSGVLDDYAELQQEAEVE